MEERAYVEFVNSITKPGQEILDSLTPEKCNLLHMALGIVGEAAEVSEIIKKHVIYNKELNMDKLIEELGDKEFYTCGMRHALEISHGDVILANHTKLSKRYSSGTYSDSQAIDRADKEELE